MDKSPNAFRTISEVADDLDLPQHVLRFWETRFAAIRPLKRGGGRRYYRPDDVDLLRGIQHYLYGEGYTIKGVQRILKERGIRHVVEMGQAQVENFAPPIAMIPTPRDEETRRAQAEWPEARAAARQVAAAERGPPSIAETVDGTPHAPAPRPEPARDERSAGLPPARPARPAAAPSLERESKERLKAILIDLIECKKILDQAR